MSITIDEAKEWAQNVVRSCSHADWLSTVVTGQHNGDCHVLFVSFRTDAKYFDFLPLIRFFDPLHRCRYENQSNEIGLTFEGKVNGDPVSLTFRIDIPTNR